MPVIALDLDGTKLVSALFAKNGKFLHYNVVLLENAMDATSEIDLRPDYRTLVCR